MLAMGGPVDAVELGEEVLEASKSLGDGMSM
jgi:hypothetical protein